MNQKQLKTYSLLVTKLQEIKHPDSSRIAKEIMEYTENETIIGDILSRLSENEPWEYIRGWGEFRNLRISVEASTLIPRIETEKIVDLTKKFVTKTTKRIVDIGSGSGAIILALAKELENPNIEFIAIENSLDAVNVIKKNSVDLELKDISIINSDLLQEISADEKDTIIVSNLPYISVEEFEKLQPSVREYEPYTALVGGKLGDELIVKLLNDIQKRFKKVKAIILEASPSTLPHIKEVAKELFAKSSISIEKDCYDQDRFITIKIS